MASPKRGLGKGLDSMIPNKLPIAGTESKEKKKENKE